ncbi:ABC transporter substrate-binding protein [Microbispora sp. NPDC046933]|uniref:ABC transporter substrate-binding protein n=1 Tax=Microbispora sp. NPDC046933 TaxID=3155618 RepID=UPI0033E6ED8B
MRRFVVGAMAAACSATMLSACSSAPDATNGNGKETVTITFWNTNTASDRPAVEQIVRDFNDSQQGIRVNMTIMPYDVFQQKILPAYKSGSGPTVAAFEASTVAGYAARGLIQQIDDLYSPGLLDKNAMAPALLAPSMWNGHTYAAPFEAGPAMLYYNKKLLAKAGFKEPATTLEGIVEQAIKTTRYAEGKDQSNVYGFPIPDHASLPIWAPLIWSRGGEIVSTDGKTSQLDSPQTVAAVDYWKNLMQQQHISPAGLAGSDMSNLFSAGRATFVLDGPWSTTNYTAAKVDYGVMPFPAGESGSQMTIAAGAALAVASRIPNASRQAALKFLAFWNSKQSQVTWSVKSSYPPNRTDIPAGELAANPTASLFAAKQNMRFFPGAVLKANDIVNNVFIPTVQRIERTPGSAADVLKSASAALQSDLQ